MISILLLAIMEVSFSFDNAVVNAQVLRKLSPFLQKVFLTLGILVSVFLVRLILPAVIVSFSADLPLQQVIHMSHTDYQAHVLAAHSIIASFGGTFLLALFLSFLFYPEREHYWVDWLERHAGTFPSGIKWALFSFIMSSALYLTKSSILPAAIAGIVLLAMGLLENFLTSEKAATYSGLAAFLYLELLDASFSLDGVIGAFAMSSDIVVIMAGLGIGSFCIRSMTVYMVKHKTLEAFKYLEHGAHYSIGALGCLMLLSNVFPIPQLATGLVGIAFILLAAITSKVEYVTS